MADQRHARFWAERLIEAGLDVDTGRKYVWEDPRVADAAWPLGWGVLDKQTGTLYTQPEDMPTPWINKLFPKVD